MEESLKSGIFFSFFFFFFSLSLSFYNCVELKESLKRGVLFYSYVELGLQLGRERGGGMFMKFALETRDNTNTKHKVLRSESSYFNQTIHLHWQSLLFPSN